MIDLDEIERWSTGMSDIPVEMKPATVVALVRAVRAAEVITDWREFSAAFAGPDLIGKQREDWDALEAALAPFRPLGLHA